MGLSFLISQWSGSFSPAGLVDSTQIPREVGGLRVLGLLVRRQTMEQPSFQDKELYVDISTTRSGEKMPFTYDGHFTLKTTQQQVGIVIYCCCCCLCYCYLQTKNQGTKVLIGDIFKSQLVGL